MKIIRLLFLLSALLTTNAFAATCTSTGNADWQSKSWTGTGCTNNGPAAGSDVIITTGTSILVDKNTATVANVTVNTGGTLTVQKNQSLTLTGNFAVNGTFTAQAGSTVALTGTNQTISGNVTFSNLTVGANTILTLTGNIVVNGTTNLTPANLGSTCPSNYTVTNTQGAVLGQSCAGGGGGGGSGGGAATASPSLCVNDASIGTQPWTGLTNVGSQNNIYAQATGINGQITNYLKCTGYGFNIPAGATITGITVGVWDYSVKTMSDQSMVLVKANSNQTGPLGTMDLATQTRFTGTNSEVIYGGATNLWGNTWTAADINSATFGAAFAAIRGPYNTTDTAFVDYMPITIDYTISAPPAPMAYYHMDEASWNGAANQVVDSSGNGNNAQPFNSSTTDGVTPAIPGNLGTCRYGVFDNGTTITSGYIQTPLPDLTTDFTVTAWIRTTNNTVSGQRILIDDQNNTGGYGISLGDGGTGKIRFYSRAINPVIFDSAYPVANNTWYFVAAVADTTNRKRSIYVFSQSGTLLNASNEGAAYSGTWGNDNGPVSIGGETNASGEPPASFHFHGNLDEVQVFQAALSQTQLAQIATQTHPCAANVPDHLEIDHASGTGLTCTPSTLTIKACADAACTTAYTSGVTGTLSGTGTTTVNWSGGSGFSIPAGSSTVTKDVQVTTPGTTVFSATSSPASATATTCNFGTPACTFTSSDSGFLVSAPNHVAESSSTLTVQAVKKADNSLACVPAFASTSKSVNLQCAYVNPASGTLPVRVGGAALNASGSTAAACDGTGANVTLNFDATGTATPALQYADVGQMSVSAAYTGIPGSQDAGLSMTGTGSFIAAPYSFSLSGITAGTIKAGNPFGATVTARNALGNITPNFGKESTPGPEGVTLTSKLVIPDPLTFPAANNPNPPGNGIIPGSEFGAGGMVNDANGVATVNNLSWGEVGSITLTASLTSASYLGSGLTAPATPTATSNSTSATVGPFIPDHFDTAVVATALAPMPCPNNPAVLTCPALFNGFVYSGQPFSEQVTARNLAGGTTTNYHSGYGLSNNVTLSAWDAPASVATQNPGGGALAINPMPFTAFIKGLGTTSTQAYTFATTPTSPTDIYLRAVDAVNTSVTSRGATPATTAEGGVKVVSGKVYISNAHGSELLPLPLTATVQYWDGISWVTSTTDSLTQFNTNLSTAGGNLVANIVTGLGGGVSVSTPGLTTGGPVKNFTLNKPGVVGSVDISLNAPVYLLGGSNGAGINPSKVGRATFGVYKGPDEFIYLRENY